MGVRLIATDGSSIRIPNTGRWFTRHHSVKGHPIICSLCRTRLEQHTRYAWCPHCRGAITCACPWWRAPWSSLLRWLRS